MSASDFLRTTFWRRLTTLAAASMALMLILSACGSDDDNDNSSEGSLPGDEFDRPVRFADLGWDSAIVENRIAQYILENGYGYETEAIPGETIPLLQGLINGDVDIYIEVTVDQQPSYPPAVENGDVLDHGLNWDGSVQGWYVPTYVIEGDEERGIEPMAPDLKHVNDLPQYAELFEDPEEAGMGRFYDCIAGWECERVNEAKFNAYGLNESFNRFLPGSGTALTASLASAYERGEPWVGYYWGPTWIFAMLDLTALEEPEYTDECWEEIFEGDEACAYPVMFLNIATNPDFAEANPEVIEFLENWELQDDHVSEFLLKMQEEQLTHEEVAVWFLQEYDDLWSTWLPEDAAERVRQALEDESI